ncbi:MAG: cobalt-precorrin-5B (C(1))-methyltransferase [Hyphomicrobiales bacterium]|nr:cobalt-precorrin-5B (C(1))-methyltransferase [Hyphomicrobiales bacterium]
MTDGQLKDLRFGYTTGACATAAAKAAVTGLLTGSIPQQVEIVLPRGQRAVFQIAESSIDAKWARVAIQKDAGDDPDVTHGAMIVVTIRPGQPHSGITFRAGAGVGVITKAGLPIPPGEPAINPVPRRMIEAVLEETTEPFAQSADFIVEISVPGGEELAKQTWNPRLGIVGGLSILGTTGIVRPFSCAAWIASIHRGIDVARANGVTHAVGSTGATSEQTAQQYFGLPDMAMLDMGDFAGGLLKYLRRHPLPRLTIAGGIGKLTKLAQGALDLHSSRSKIDFEALGDVASTLGADKTAITMSNTAQHALDIAGPQLAASMAAKARDTACGVLTGAAIDVDCLVVDRSGKAVAIADGNGARILP